MKMVEACTSTNDLLYSFKISCLAPRMRKVPRYVEWISPSSGVLKFNVDCSAIGKLGPTGIGGVLRDCNAKVKGLFSVKIGVADSNYAELRAVLEALVVYDAQSEIRGSSLIIESDSYNCVSWVNGDEVCCWKYANTLNQIHNLIRKIGGVSITKIFREANKFADNLAKQGVYRYEDFRAMF